MICLHIVIISLRVLNSSGLTHRDRLPRREKMAGPLSTVRYRAWYQYSRPLRPPLQLAAMLLIAIRDSRHLLVAPKYHTSPSMIFCKKD